MTLANRLVGDWTKCPFAMIERCDLHGPGWALPAFLAELGEDLFTAGGRRAGAVVLPPGRIEDGTGFELMVIGETVEAARARADAIGAAPAPPAGLPTCPGSPPR